jgi:acylpyruvate hydrolase
MIPPASFKEGDVILTGTPSGVGPIHPGDKIECALGDPTTDKQLATLAFTAIARNGGYHFTA